MSESNNGSRVPRTFSWDSPDVGKEEHAEFMAVLKQSLGQNSYLLNESMVNLAMPDHHGPEPAAALAKKEWERKKERYTDLVLKLYRDFNSAAGTLRSIFPYGSVVRSDIDMTYDNRPPLVLEADWTPRAQFQAVLSMLKAGYSRSTATDYETLRTKTQNLSDKVPGGYFEYRREFSKHHAMLVATGDAAVISATQCREWVRKGISNPEVFRYLIPYYVEHPDATFQDIFNYVDKYMAICIGAEQDPYKIISGASGKASININSYSADTRGHGQRGKILLPKGDEAYAKFCTKCWMKGHSWSECERRNCAVCHAPIGKDDKSCPNWRQHKSADFRFSNDQAPWERNYVNNSKSKTSESNRNIKRPSSVASSSSARDDTFTSRSSAVPRAVKRAMNVVAKHDKKARSG